MDYETPDGSHFSLQEIFDEQDDFSYTSVSAVVDGEALAGRLDVRMVDADDGDLLTCLKPVPLENIYPRRPPALSVVSDFDTANHYLKSPSFSYADSLPGRHFVADCVLREAMMYELLKTEPHANIAQYVGCNVEQDRIRRLVLERYEHNLLQHAGSDDLSAAEASRIFEQVLAAIKHIHRLGYAHNDLNPHNICIAADGRAVLIDLDSCLPFGEPLLKGVAVNLEQPQSDIENDWQAMDELDEFLREAVARSSISTASKS